MEDLAIIIKKRSLHANLEFHAVFDHFDDDNDGLLSPVEVSYMMTTLGYPPKRILRELTVKLMKEGHSKKHAR